MLKALERGDLAEASFVPHRQGQWSPDYTGTGSLRLTSTAATCGRELRGQPGTTSSARERANRAASS